MKDFVRNLNIKQIGAAMTALIVLAGAASVTSLLVIDRKVADVGQMWTEFDQGPASKTAFYGPP